jgi:GGDEF domain-containing protein
VALMLNEVDHLEQIHHLYGFESREEILLAVISLLRSLTRESDFLGCMLDGRLMAVFPHTSKEGVNALAARLLRGSRSLDFRSGGHALRLTLSMGVAVSDLERDLSFDEFVRAAEDAVRYAADTGGNRYVQREPARALFDGFRRDLDRGAALIAEEQAEIERRRKAGAQKPVLRPVPPPGPGAPAAGASSPPRPDRPFAGVGAGESETSLGAQIEALFRAFGAASPELEQLQAELTALSETTVDLARQQAMADVVSEHADKVERLERRLSKLKEMLDATENELRRIAKLKGVEEGLASIYRTVQGLTNTDEDYHRKREMLTLIFEANVDLQRRIRGG